MSDKITAIVVTYNSADVVVDCVKSLKDTAKVIVVDNASEDDLAPLLAPFGDHVTLIRNPKNEGYGRGNNIGFAATETPYALVVNPDAELTDGATAELEMAAREYPGFGILAPLLVDDTGRPQPSFKKDIFTRDRGHGEFHVPAGPASAGFLSGAVLLVNMEMVARIGGFDPNIFLYYEDDDLCLRAHNAGYDTLVVPAARAIHHRGASSSDAETPSSIRLKNINLTWSKLYLENKYEHYTLAGNLWLVGLYAFKSVTYRLLLNRPKAIRSQGRMLGAIAFLKGETPFPNSAGDRTDR